MSELYSLAKKSYADLGVDTEKALAAMKDISVSTHCWQGDDVGGFDSPEALSGGIQTTGNSPARQEPPTSLWQTLTRRFR